MLIRGELSDGSVTAGADITQAGGLSVSAVGWAEFSVAAQRFNLQDR